MNNDINVIETRTRATFHQQLSAIEHHVTECWVHHSKMNFFSPGSEKAAIVPYSNLPYGLQLWATYIMGTLNRKSKSLHFPLSGCQHKSSQFCACRCQCYSLTVTVSRYHRYRYHYICIYGWYFYRHVYSTNTICSLRLCFHVVFWRQIHCGWSCFVFVCCMADVTSFNDRLQHQEEEKVCYVFNTSFYIAFCAASLIMNKEISWAWLSVNFALSLRF